MSLDTHLETLEQRHSALDSEIASLRAKPATPDGEIAELRKKLLLKDEIERLRTNRPN